MKERRIEDRLDELEVEVPAESEERASAWLGERLSKGSTSSTRLRVAGAGLLLAGALFSPPGQAVAERLGELVGIGDEPTIESRSPDETGAIVIGSGEAPGGDDVELVALRVEAKTGQVDTEVRTCISFDSPKTSRSSGTCWSDFSPTASQAKVLAAPSALYPESQFVVQGIAGSNVETVEVTLAQPGENPRALPVVTGQLTEPLAQAIGSDQEATAFLAFVPQLVDQLIGLSREEAASVIRSINITTFDESGGIVSEGGGILSGGLDPAAQGGVIPLPDDPLDPRRIDLPIEDIPTGPVPAGSGTTFDTGIEGIPSPFASIGSGPDPERLKECTEAFATGEIRGESLSASDVEICGIVLAQEAGTIEAGKYSREELAQAIEDADVVPDRYGLPFTRGRNE